MKLTEKISWLMGRVQKSLFPHLNECLPAPLTEQEKRLVSILEIVEVERHVPRIVTRYRYPGRKPLDRQSLARSFVAKVLYRYPTTSDLHRALGGGINAADEVEQRRLSASRRTGDGEKLALSHVERNAPQCGHDETAKCVVLEDLVDGNDVLHGWPGDGCWMPTLLALVLVRIVREQPVK